MPARRGEQAVRLGIPALLVAGMTLVALWRVGTPPPPVAGGARVGQPSAPLPPVTRLADVLAADAIGRRASLESVRIREIPSTRTLWVGTNGSPVFVVLDPDVKRSHEARVVAGARVTLIGLVRPAPSAEVAMRQWSVDMTTAQTVEQRGTYLHATEVRPAS